jgi:neutral trehalase
MNLSNYQKVKTFIGEILPKLKKKADNQLSKPYLTVTYGQHYNSIFCWDNHHMSLRFAAAGEPEQMRYFLENMLNFQNSQRFVPNIINAVDGASQNPDGFHAQPFLGQNAAIYLKNTGDSENINNIFSKLQKYLSYWLRAHKAPFGLYRWHETYMSGFDNEIAGTIFTPDSIISPDLNSWLYLELLSMAYISKELGKKECYEKYYDDAQKLKKAINCYLWDEEYGTYAAWDLSIARTRMSWGEAGLDSSIGEYAYLSCPSLVPFYAGIADKNQAELAINRYVISPKHFRSKYGIRSLSKASEYYNNARWGNPSRFGNHRRLTNSNWQGPVWIPLNWFVFHALLEYGFKSEAEKLADDTIKVIAQSIDRLGYMRENFHAETGEPLYADYFASWNILADLMPMYLNKNSLLPDLFVWRDILK